MKIKLEKESLKLYKWIGIRVKTLVRAKALPNLENKYVQRLYRKFTITGFKN